MFFENMKIGMDSAFETLLMTAETAVEALESRYRETEDAIENLRRDTEGAVVALAKNVGADVFETARLDVYFDSIELKTGCGHSVMFEVSGDGLKVVDSDAGCVNGEKAGLIGIDYFDFVAGLGKVLTDRRTVKAISETLSRAVYDYETLANRLNEIENEIESRGY